MLQGPPGYPGSKGDKGERGETQKYKKLRRRQHQHLSDEAEFQVQGPPGPVGIIWWFNGNKYLIK
jgi:hypothetical protein